MSCSRSVVLLLEAGDPVFLLDRDGEAAGTFSRHSPEGRREHQQTLSVNFHCCNMQLHIESDELVNA